MLRRLQEKYIQDVVSVHLKSFPGFFLSFLGARFLSVYYSGICSAKEGVGFVFINNNGIPIGFVAGTVNPRGFYSKLLKRDWFRFSLASVGAICKNPSVLTRLCRAFFHPSENSVGDDVAGLFSIGVLPEFQSNDIGGQLVNAFLEEVRTRGCNRVFLTTDRVDNDVVNNFYKKLGFKIQRQFVTPEHRQMNELCIDLNNKPTEGVVNV